jgi:hypothetical protein
MFDVLQVIFISSLIAILPMILCDVVTTHFLGERVFFVDLSEEEENKDDE